MEIGRGRLMITERRLLAKGPRLFPSNAQCCEADLTLETAVREELRGAWNGEMGEASAIRFRKVRAKKIMHRRGRIYFWHWSDQEILDTETYSKLLNDWAYEDAPLDFELDYV